MKKIFITFIFVLLFGASSVAAQQLDAMQLDPVQPQVFEPVDPGITGETDKTIDGDVDGAKPAGVDEGVPTDSGNMQGNVETEFKVEKGEKAAEPGDAIMEKSSGDDAMKDDSNVDVPQDSAEDDLPIPTQYNESDLDFIQRLSNPVGIKGVEVRGWDSKKKEEFLETVKEHAELASEQDLENFAAGVLLKDENIESALIETDKIEVDYRMPAKFLGIFESRLTAKATVETGAGEEILPDKYGRVKVKFPWYRIFYRVPKDVQANSLEKAINDELGDKVSDTLESAIQKQGQVFQLLSNIMKVKHDTAMAIIRKIGG